MYSFGVLSTVALGLALVNAEGMKTGELGNATVVTNNPVGLSAAGSLPDKPFFTAGSLSGNVKGSVSVKSSPDGIGVVYTVKFSNLPKEGGPFPYHIHEKKVPDGGNCTSTGAHLDPTIRGETPVCDKAFPQTCQVGDLSGKYGAITSDPFEATYTDIFGSMTNGANASIPDRSFVVHFSNKTRISCANFEMASSANPSSSSAPVPVPSSSATTGLNSTPTAPITSPVVTAGANVMQGVAFYQPVWLALFGLFFAL
ncbi:superoxide dismutase [Apiospora kogelbergensis]|uniref:superoxide dismutase n=1 Tax=Apiospora kogelbergensis TaxID=1337665 RepID=A0AAW0Q401_9PEZI